MSERTYCVETTDGAALQGCLRLHVDRLIAAGIAVNVWEEFLEDDDVEFERLAWTADGWIDGDDPLRRA